MFLDWLWLVGNKYVDIWGKMHKKTMENSGEFSRTASHYTIGSGGILDVKLNGLRA